MQLIIILIVGYFVLKFVLNERRANTGGRGRQYYEPDDNYVEPTQYHQPQQMQVRHDVHHHAPADKKGRRGKNVLKCPKCRSVNIAKLDSNRKGFSAKKAVVGAIIVPVAGSLVGFAGGRRSKQIFACNNCGQTFKFKVK